MRYGPHSPRDEDIVDFNNLIIKDFTDKNKTLAKVENVEIKISFYNLHDKKDK